MRDFRVLVVEDDESIRESVRELLELIILDLNMPVMSGHEFLSRIRREGGPPARIPVLIMTAVPDTQVSGVSGLLRKPVEIEEILEKVREFAT